MVVLAVFTLFAIAACSDDSPSPFSTTTPVSTEDQSAPSGSDDTVASGPDIANGESKFTSLGCSGCHTTGTNKLVGPGLAGMNSKSDDYIRQSIVDPSAVLVDGFANLMPTTFADLKESDLEDLVAYLKTLG
jgi:cytochrome c oxidase subunit 2